MKIKAKYIIETNDERLSFEADPLSFMKCVQIENLAKSGKSWKGYKVTYMHFNMEGLIEIQIKNFKIEIDGK